MANLTLEDLRSDVRSLILEPKAHMFEDSDLRLWCNFGIRDFSSRVLWYSRIVAKPVLTNIFEYDLPSDILKLELVRFQEKYRPRVIDEAEWSAVTYLNNGVSKTYPDFAFLYPHDKRLAIWPKPSVGRPAAQLNGAIDAAQTSMVLMNVGGVFPDFGYVIIEGEQIRYQQIFGGLTLADCRRGDGDTTAAAHANGATVELAELQLFTRALPPDLVVDADIPKFPAQYVEALVFYCAHRAYMRRQMYEQSGALYKMYLQKREEAAEERLQASLDMGGGVKDEEFGTGHFGASFT
jgi:hypothetical protein